MALSDNLAKELNQFETPKKTILELIVLQTTLSEEFGEDKIYKHLGIYGYSYLRIMLHGVSNYLTIKYNPETAVYAEAHEENYNYPVHPGFITQGVCSVRRRVSTGAFVIPSSYDLVVLPMINRNIKEDKDQVEGRIDPEVVAMSHKEFIEKLFNLFPKRNLFLKNPNGAGFIPLEDIAPTA